MAISRENEERIDAAWDAGMNLLKIAYLLEQPEAGKYKITKGDLKRIDKLNQALSNLRKSHKKPKKLDHGRRLSSTDLFGIYLLHESLKEIFKTKKCNELSLPYCERLAEVRRLVNVECGREETDDQYPLTIYKKMAIPKKTLMETNESGSNQLDSPSKYADYALSILLNVSAKTIQRGRLKRIHNDFGVFELILGGHFLTGFHQRVAEKLKNQSLW